MKKILSAVLAVAMLCTCVLMFTACGGNNSSAASSWEVSPPALPRADELESFTDDVGILRKISPIC